MKWGRIRFGGVPGIPGLLLSIVLFSIVLFSINAAHAGETARLSGSYQIVHKTEARGQTSIRLQLHLVNHGSTTLRVQRITLWNFSHPSAGATQPASLIVRAASSADTVQEFIVSNAEYELLKRGARPRLVLELVAPTGRTTTETVRLDGTAGRKGN